MRNRAARALAFPLEDPEWLSKIAVGGAVGLGLQALFVVLGFLLSRELALEASPLAQAANFPALGFALQVFKGALTVPQAEAMPRWRRWSALCLQGLFLFLLGLCYSIVPLLLIISGFGLLVRGGVMLGLGLFLMLLGMLAGVTFVFFLPMAVARYLEEGRMEAAFHPAVAWSGIRKVLTEYMAAYILSIGLFILMGLIGTVPFLGVLAWPFLTFYLLVASARLFGGACSGGA